MEFSTEFIQKTGLNEDQIKAISTEVESHVADQKKAWDGKATADAENILTDVATKVYSMTGIQREKGVKFADYLSLASENYLKGQKADLERKEKELEEKIKSGSDELTKKELERAKDELSKVKVDLDKYKAVAAEHEEWKTNDYKGKYEQTYEKLTAVEERVAFQSVKPVFPENVNKYEASAKWREFIESVKSKNKIVEENEEYYAIDKENEHKKIKLSDLVEKDKTIQDLAKGRSITGLGDKTKKEQKSIDGIPFKIDEGATPADIQKSIKDYLTSELNLSITSREYASKFGELYQKIKTQKTA